MFPNQNFSGNMNNNFNNMNLNQDAYQAFLNMMNMNLNNSMDINNFMMQFIMMNPNFFQNNFIPQNNFQQFNNMQSINLGNVNPDYINRNGGVIPRPKNFNNMNIDSFPGYNSRRINIIFETGTGLKINMATPICVSVEELLIKFAYRVGVGQSLLGTKIFFIVNGATIQPNEKTQVGNYFRDFYNNLKDQVKIIVLDASNVIGA